VPDLDVNALLTAKEAAGYAGVSIGVVCKWRERGHLPVAIDEQGREIRDKQGRPRYRLLDVAKAENATKRRAEQMARRITRRDPDQRLAA
jgi:predicted site-specific integrase-resolvase